MESFGAPCIVFTIIMLKKSQVLLYVHVQYVYVQKYNRKLILERVLNWCLYLYCSLSPWPQNQKMCKKIKWKKKNQVDFLFFFYFFKDYQYFIVETHPNPYSTTQSGKYILDKWIYKNNNKEKAKKTEKMAYCYEYKLKEFFRTDLDTSLYRIKAQDFYRAGNSEDVVVL